MAIEPLHAHLQQITALILKLLDNSQVVRSLSWDTVSQMAEMYRANNALLNQHAESSVQGEP